MTGKIGGWAVGALRSTIARRGQQPTPPIRVTMTAPSTASRGRREFGDSSVGGLVTSRSFAVLQSRRLGRYTAADHRAVVLPGAGGDELDRIARRRGAA